MNDWNYEDLPFFDESHQSLSLKLKQWLDNSDKLDAKIASLNLVEQCSVILNELYEYGFLDYIIPDPSSSDEPKVDVRSVTLIREALAYHSALADFVFAMQGIGTAGIWLYGNQELQNDYLLKCREGKSVAALALSEKEGGSDVAATKTSAVLDGDDYIINGSKAWISNGGVADHYIVVVRTEDLPGYKGLSAFLVDGDTPGLSTGQNVELVSPHILSEVYFENCRVHKSRMLGLPGEGFKLAMSTLDIFRASVGGAAVGLAKRAMDETKHRVKSRYLFGKTMSEMDIVISKVAEMAMDIDSAALLVYRAGWLKDIKQKNITKEAAMAKLSGSEHAFRVIDSAVQLFGGLGVTQGCIIEQLYRDIRPMRIYEGASEIQKIIIGRNVLKS